MDCSISSAKFPPTCALMPEACSLEIRFWSQGHPSVGLQRELCWLGWWRKPCMLITDFRWHPVGRNIACPCWVQSGQWKMEGQGGTRGSHLNDLFSQWLFGSNGALDFIEGSLYRNKWRSPKWEQAEAIYSEFAISRESLCLAETQRQAGDWESIIVKKKAGSTLGVLWLEVFGMGTG